MGTRFVRDPQSASFVGLRNRCVPQPAEGSTERRRNVVEMMSSKDLLSWETRSTLLHDPPSGEIGFYSADWSIDGDDLVAVIVSEIPKSASDPEDAAPQALLFLRIPGFRDRKPDDPPLWGPPPPK
jgi:hypothetical protein